MIAASGWVQDDGSPLSGPGKLSSNVHHESTLDKRVAGWSGTLLLEEPAKGVIRDDYARSDPKDESVYSNNDGLSAMTRRVSQTPTGHWTKQ